MHSIASRPAAPSRPTVQDEIGPRLPGAIYATAEGRFEVLALVTNPAGATQLLRRAARWAVIVRDTLRPDSQPVAVGTAWTISDYLVRPAKTAYASAA